MSVLQSQYVRDVKQDRQLSAQLVSGAHVVAGTLSSLGSHQVQTLLQQRPGSGPRKPPFTCIIIDEVCNHNVIPD